jgi:hypothetical protein
MKYSHNPFQQGKDSIAVFGLDNDNNNNNNDNNNNNNNVDYMEKQCYAAIKNYSAPSNVDDDQL